MACSLSIIVLTCNQQAMTRRLLDSLGEFMESNRRAEVVIVDNGSTDGTQAAVSAMNLPWQSRLKYIALPENIGVARGRNAGLREASGEVIMILDNDTIVNREALEYMLGRVTAEPSIGILAPALRSPAGELQDSAKPYPGFGLKLRHFISQKWRRGDETPLKGECEPCYVIGACQMFRREVLEATGMLDEKIFYGPEDADYCLRVRRLGYRIVYDPRAQIVHDWQRATSRRRFSHLSLLHILSLLYFYRKYRRWL